jgi:hypothetical protein
VTAPALGAVCKRCGFEVTIEFGPDVPNDEVDRHAARIRAGQVHRCRCGGGWRTWVRYGGVSEKGSERPS